MVEITRALSHEARLIIMDEPTAALSAHEIEELFRIVDQLRRDGRSILFISHKFDEIFRLSDRWICLRDGEKVGEGRTCDVGEADLVRLMVGRPIDQVFPKRDIPIGATVLEVEGLSNATEFDDISFLLRRSEILGFYGLVGAGRSEAMQCLFGLSQPTRGSVSVDGQPLTIDAPSDAIAARHRLCAGGPAEAPGAPSCRSASGRTPPSRRWPSTSRAGCSSRPSELDATRRLGTRLSGEGRALGAAARRALRRQPAEGGDRQVARHPAQDRHPGRAHQGHRHRLQGGRARLHRRSWPRRAWPSSWSPPSCPRSWASRTASSSCRRVGGSPSFRAARPTGVPNMWWPRPQGRRSAHPSQRR